jgi:hypothetical protein
MFQLQSLCDAATRGAASSFCCCSYYGSYGEGQSKLPDAVGVGRGEAEAATEEKPHF